MGEARNKCFVLWRKLKGKKAHGGIRVQWEDNI
jgi:hypothetical protein